MNALTKSKMPVLAANMSMEGKASGETLDSGNPFAKVRPYILREIDGIKNRHYRGDHAGNARFGFARNLSEASILNIR